MEDVRLIVQEEGRAARNLIAFNVPVEHSTSDTGKTVTRKPPTSPRPSSESKKDDAPKLVKRTSENTKSGSRVRSASTGRDKKSVLQARHWAFLFENLFRAVDELYQTCESDENISECKEVILILENYTKEFHSLIKWLHLKWDLESTPPPLRPTSLAWEIRKSSPGKIVSGPPFQSNSHKKKISKNVSLNGKVLNSFSSSSEKNVIFGKAESEKKSVDYSLDRVESSDNTDNVKSLESYKDNDGSKISDVKELCDSDKKATCENVSEEPLIVGKSSPLVVNDHSVGLVCSEDTDVVDTVSMKNETVEVNGVAEIESNKDVVHDVKNDCNNDVPCISDAMKTAQLHVEFTVGDISDTVTVNNSTVIATTGTTNEVDSKKIQPIENNILMFGDVSVYPDDIVVISGKGSTQDASVSTSCDYIEASTLPSCDTECNSSGSDVKVVDESQNVHIVKKTHQESQTDLEYCVEESGLLKFYPVIPPTAVSSAPSNETTPAVSIPSTTTTIVSKTVNSSTVPNISTGVTRSLVRANTSFASTASAFVAVTKTSSASGSKIPPTSFRSPTASSRSSPRVVPGSVGVNRAPLTRQPYSAVSKQLLNSSMRPLSANAAQLTRSRTSTDVRSTIKSAGMLVRRPTGEAGVALRMQQKPIPNLRQNRMTTGMVSQAAPSKPTANIRVSTKEAQQHMYLNKTPLEKRASVDHGSGSNLSLSSSASSQRSCIERTRAADPNAAESVEVLARTSSNTVDDDNQGWETVKGRSRSRISPFKKTREANSASGNIKTHFTKHGYSAKSRFNQPSSAMSLPALSLAEVEVCPPAAPKQKRPSPLSSTNIAKDKKDMKDEKSMRAVKSGAQVHKFISAEKKMSNQEKSNNMKNKLKSKEKISTENKENENSVNSIVTVANVKIEDGVNREIVKDLPTDSSGKKTELTQMESECLDDVSPDEENNLDKLLDEKNLLNEQENKELCEEVAMLRKEIHDLETGEIEVDTETEDTETDSEVAVDGNVNAEQKPVFDENVSLEIRYENELQALSWADQMDTLQQLEELVSRHPGRALELHQKLSSPSRRGPLPDAVRHLHNKQAKATEKREQLMLEKTNRLRELLNKVEEVKAQQAQSIEEKRVRLEMKLQRAEMNREHYLKGIVRKAHNEEEKLKEIAFINELEAQNKQLEFMSLYQNQEERLQGIQEERQRKHEEKAAKEAAAEERRKAIEAIRQNRLEKMQEERRKREERIGRKLQEKEMKRQNLARKKAKDRESRLSALNAGRMANLEELQKKIQQKQEDSARRHEENIEHIRHRALESSILKCSTQDEVPKLAPYETKKLCQLCSILIGSEVYLLSHLRGQKHQDMLAKQLEEKDLPSKEDVVLYNLQFIIDAPADKIDPKIMLDKERQKALKKRCKKLKLRMASRGQDYENSNESPEKVDCPNKARLQKCIKDVDKLHSSQGKGQWPNNAITSLERALGEINRILNKQNALDQVAFRVLNGFTSVSNILLLALDVPQNMPSYLPPKCFVTACTSYSYACRESVENSKFVLMSNKISTILDLLHHKLAELTEKSRTSASSVLPVDPIAGSLMRLLAQILKHATEGAEDKKQEIWSRIQDVISYAICVGIVDKLAFHCARIRDPIDSDPSQFLLCGIELLTTFAARCAGVRRGNHDDPTQLVATLQVTELVGAVSMLYGMLLHQGAPSRGTSPPPSPLPPYTVAVTTATIRLLSQVAQLDLHMFQSVLGAEGISLQFRHIASYLLWYCSHDQEELLHEVIRVVGYFAVNNHDNQMMIQSGYMPTVLQQLCNLPFPYFSNPSLSILLFPTLLACCSGNKENRAILEQEVSYQLLEDFKNSESGRSDPLVALLANNDSST